MGRMRRSSQLACIFASASCIGMWWATQGPQLVPPPLDSCSQTLKAPWCIKMWCMRTEKCASIHACNTWERVTFLLSGHSCCGTAGGCSRSLPVGPVPG